MMGLFCTSLMVSVVSVYLFHDVDREMIGRWNEALAASCFEGILFTLIITIPVWLLTFLGQRLLHLTGNSPRLNLALLVGIGIAILQYASEVLARIATPNFVDFVRLIYLMVSIVLCTVVLLLDSFDQKRRYGFCNFGD